MLYSNRDYYHGEWVNDKREGVGRLFMQNEEKLGGGSFIYEGHWVKDQMSGEGFLINLKEETITKGNWRQDKMEGNTKILKYKNIG